MSIAGFRTLARVGLTLAVAAAGCVAWAGGDSPADRVALAGGIYIGVLPCADCEGIRYRLHLRADRAFVLETGYLGQEPGPANPGAVLGVWTESADGRTLELRHLPEPPLYFAIRDVETLRKLDMQGRPIRSKLNYDLLRSHAVEKFQPVLRLQGMYSYMADAGVFRECQSGARFPVAQLADNAALERGYGAARAEPGQPILVAVEARIAARPSMEGDRLEDALVVERFIGASPGESCGAALAATERKQ